MNSCSDHRSACRNRHADKVFASRTSRILGLRILADVESRQSACAGNNEEERYNCAGLDDLLAQIRLPEFWKLMASPHPGEDRRCNSKGDYVGERIQLASEVAGGVRHARDAAVESVEKYGEAYRLGCVIEVERSAG